MKKFLAGAALCFMFATPSFATETTPPPEEEPCGCVPVVNYNEQVQVGNIFSKQVSVQKSDGTGANYNGQLQKLNFGSKQISIQKVRAGQSYP